MAFFFSFRQSLSYAITLSWLSCSFTLLWAYLNDSAVNSDICAFKLVLSMWSWDLSFCKISINSLLSFTWPLKSCIVSVFVACFVTEAYLVISTTTFALFNSTFRFEIVLKSSPSFFITVSYFFFKFSNCAYTSTNSIFYSASRSSTIRRWSVASSDYLKACLTSICI